MEIDYKSPNVELGEMLCTIQYNTQTLIEEELYAAYFAWLLQFEPFEAYRYIDSNLIFALNLGVVKYNQMRTELFARKETQ